MADAAVAEGLWDWSLRAYGRPGVAAACLEAQDRSTADVNLLLWAAWTGAVHGHVLTGGELDAAHAAVADWHRDVVAPLRAVRRRLKFGPAPAPAPATAALRERIKAAELEAERLEQVVLADHPRGLRRDAAPAAALAANLARLLGANAAAPLITALSGPAADIPEPS